MKGIEQTVEKAVDHLKASNLSEAWERLAIGEKKYAAYLVKRYGWTVEMAMQRVYVFGYDSYPYDFRTGKIVAEERPRDYFGLGRV